MHLLLIAGATLLVGLSIGLCGVAGFLLPIFFLGYCGFSSTESLFLSFGCFLISGVIGAKNYQKRGEMPIKEALPLGLSSLAGGLAGAMLGRFFAQEHMKTILYAVVLVSGIMILVQEFLLRMAAKERTPGNSRLLIPLGLVTGAVCAMSGAGGPVLVMPLLVLLGFPVRTAVGIALFDSVFIALPALVIYGTQALSSSLLLPMLTAFLAHGVGIWQGSRLAAKIPPKPLKLGIAVFSIAFSLWMLLK